MNGNTPINSHQLYFKILQL